MPMNWFHRRLCSSDTWFAKVEETLLPWALKGVDLGADVLEIGPGFGATTRVLARSVPRLTAVEVDPASAARLRTAVPGVRVVTADATALDFPDDSFDAVVCFTMLHHVPSPAAQDRLFASAHRVLRPGGVFAGSDSRTSARFRFLHVFDTMVVVDPDVLPERLRTAGFSDPLVTTVPGSFKFRARKS
ncbi:class I SAM-dependent methyltransferase [Cryptosporangium arvum]|uniref:Methylase involved in ubiquinone/menaquinone biosynthesis n=1 Tax=Cryptosporangium arvum DSM 44712 TaxID=927661 RepID=A0A010YNF5_9ACTN|nr:class I SAM-dependent methyltransferase [Cryptosporangium arvum]EXG81705.1 methylase involved in ubiquinone/menaquinone biosynthesis [Cryptosporangium arvum DSM 44712]